MIISKKKIIRHVVVGIFFIALLYAFYASQPDIQAHKLYRATGDVGFVLLFLTLVIGPLGKVWPRTNKLLPWRRQFGIWFAISAIVHSVIILNNWIQWDWLRFLGYVFVPDLGKHILLEPGFGIASILGLVALFFTLLLAATSSDWALRFLGGSTWKWLHNAAYIIFYLTSIHALYFFFLYYEVTFHNRPFPESWFRFYAVGLMVTLIVLQIAAFIITTMKRQR